MRTTNILVLILCAAGVVASCGSSSTSSDAGTDGAAGTGAGGAGGAGGGTGETGRCDILNNGTQSCIEYSADYTGSQTAGCATLHGTFSAGACSHTNSSGGCKRTVPGAGSQTTFYYLPTVTAADVMVQCMNDANAVYVAP